MKPPWIDQGWSLVAGALANRGIHPPPTTSRPSLPPRCAAAPPTAFASPRPAATPPAAAGFQSLSSPSLSERVRKRVARLPALPTPRPRVYPRQPSRACSLSYRPSCHSCRPLKPTSLAADQPLCQRRLCQPLPPSLPPSRGRAENTEHHRHCHPRISFSRRPSYAATAITFVGKSSEAVREPRADAARGGARPQQIFFLRLLFFLSFSTFSFTLSGEERFFRAIDKII